MSWRVRGKGRTQHTPGKMNNLERAYAARLKELVYLGEIAWFSFESVKLKLAGKTFYTPDFLVIAANGDTEFHEVKGFWEEDARVKIKVAAEKFPFTFRAFKREKGIWIEEIIGSSGAAA